MSVLFVVADLGLRQKISFIFPMNSKTTEIYTHVSTKSIGKIKSPLGSLDFKTSIVDKGV